MTKLLLSIALLGTCLAASAQEIIPQEFPKRYPDGWFTKKMETHTVTDTLTYQLPNEGLITILYNSDEYSEEEIDKKLREPVSEALEFPAGKQLIYHMMKRYPETDLQNLFMQLSTEYAVNHHGQSLVLGAPIGIDYIGGHFTPEIGARVNLHIPKYTFGLSFNDVIRFEDKADGGVNTEHNLFLNLDFGYSGRKLYPENYLQIGYLLKKNSGLFEGTTLKGIYKYKLGKIVYLQAGLISTRDFNQIYPIFGISIF